MSQPDDIHLDLAGTDRLHDYHFFPEGVEYVYRIVGRDGQAPQGSPRSHRSDKDPRIGRQLLHPYAIAQYGASREGTGRINGYDAYGPGVFAQCFCERRNQRALAPPRGTGDADDMSLTGMLVEPPHDFAGGGVIVLHQAYQPGCRQAIAGANTLI